MRLFKNRSRLYKSLKITGILFIPVIIILTYLGLFVVESNYPELIGWIETPGIFLYLLILIPFYRNGLPPQDEIFRYSIWFLNCISYFIVLWLITYLILMLKERRRSNQTTG
jgi:hypothetical protein